MNTVYWVLVAFGIVVLEARLRARNVRYLPILPAIVLGAVLSFIACGTYEICLLYTSPSPRDS